MSPAILFRDICLMFFLEKGSVILRVSIACLVVLLVGGCGFHLRGYTPRITQEPLNGPVLPSFPYPYLRLARAYDPFHKSLKQQLNLQGVHVIEEHSLSQAETTKLPLLTILSQHFSEIPLAYDYSGQVQRMNLQFRASYEILDAEGTTFSPSTPLFSEREITVYPQNPLATDQEKQRLKTLLRQEVARQLVTQLSTQYQPSHAKRP